MRRNNHDKGGKLQMTWKEDTSREIKSLKIRIEDSKESLKNTDDIMIELFKHLGVGFNRVSETPAHWEVKKLRKVRKRR